jgi:hypothetical protein
MRLTGKKTYTVLLFLLLPVALFLVGCGGGGGGSSSSYTSGSGAVAVYIKDAPIDDYAELWVSLEEVSLIPPDGSEQPPVVIFNSEDANGYSINLLDLRDQELLFTVKESVPAGIYEKIRLRIIDIDPVPKPDVTAACEDMEIKLPSGKIDLNPKGEIEVKPGQTLSIKLDFDANKSINLHTAGNSGKCIFRPVIFVDIEAVDATPEECLRLLSGTIDDIIYRGDDIVVGFVLNLPDDRGYLNVFVLDAAIFDENGLLIVPKDLKDNLDKPVKVQGELDLAGDIQARLVVIGDAMTLKGTVQSGVDEFDQFSLDPAPDQPFNGEVKVALSDDTLIVLGCDKPGDRSDIVEGMLARVVGEYDTGRDLYFAVAIFLQPQQVAGSLAAMTPSEGGSILTVQPADSPPVEVFLPADVAPLIEGDGVVPLDLFDCIIGREVRVMLDPDRPSFLTAVEVRVQPEKIIVNAKKVNSSFWAPPTIEAVDDQQNELVISVPTATTILKYTVENQQATYTPIPLDLIETEGTGDRLVCFVLQACNDGSVDYSAFIILVNPPG